MRKLFVAILIFIPLVVFGILILKNKNTNPQKSSAEVVTPTPDTQNNSVDINNFTFSWYQISDISKLKLIPNFSQKLSSKDIMDQNNCLFLANGPFYSEDNQPLGLFITNGNTIADYKNNNLFNGILSVNDFETPRITENLPQDHLQIAVQTGPIIKENNNYQNLAISSDKNSRRVLAAIDGNNNLFFIVIYDKDSEFSGPLLSEVPDLLNKFETKENLNFADIINLDGGSASVFITRNFNLTEFNPVGAFFCQS